MSVPTFSQVMLLTSTVSGNAAFEDAECRALYDLCLAVPSGGVTVEIGCQLGRSSSIFLQLSSAVGFHPIFIDPWTVQPDYMAQWMAMAHATTTPFTCHMMRTDQVLASPYTIPIRRDRPSIDLLFIDGDHTAAGVIADTFMADLVRSGGVMCAHDYGRDSLPDVYDVINAYVARGGWEQLGVAGTLGMWRRI